VNRGLSLRELDKMESLVASARDAVGPEIDVCIDLHGLYNVRDVILLAHRLEPFDMMFLEDPVPPENVGSLAKVTAATPIPICTGEFVVPAGPGLGAELNEELLRLRMVEGDEFFE
tara:strand:+ start:239 stop:586 length:348 start_codon:yes stop_codon:yes gene_type:complete